MIRNFYNHFFYNASIMSGYCLSSISHYPNIESARSIFEITSTPKGHISIQDSVLSLESRSLTYSSQIALSLVFSYWPSFSTDPYAEHFFYVKLLLVIYPPPIRLMPIQPP